MQPHGRCMRFPNPNRWHTFSTRVVRAFGTCASARCMTMTGARNASTTLLTVAERSRSCPVASTPSSRQRSPPILAIASARCSVICSCAPRVRADATGSTSFRSTPLRLSLSAASRTSTFSITRSCTLRSAMFCPGRGHHRHSQSPSVSRRLRSRPPIQLREGLEKYPEQGEVTMRIDNFSFGSIRIDGRTYAFDVVIDQGTVRKRKKGASKLHRESYGHTPLSAEEDIPWNCRRLVIGTGADGALPVMEAVKAEALRRDVELVTAPTPVAIDILGTHPKHTNAILHVTC